MEKALGTHPDKNTKPMADITPSSAKENGGGKVRAKRQAIKIDMTPMVDLAFLLLTFFILTTTLTRETAMDLAMPEPVTDPAQLQEIEDEKVLNVVLAKDNRIYWWIGLDASAVKTDYSKDGVRKLLLERKKIVPDMMVLIKPMDDSRYENMVDVLDEIQITGVSRYAIVDVTDDDKARIPSASVAMR